MSFPRYPEYKDSGVEWLGEVPEPWEVVPVKTVSTCNDEVLPESTEPDYEIEYVEISDVSAGLGIISSSLMPFAAAPSRARRIVRHGDVIVSTVRTYLKAIASIHAPPDNMLVSTGFAVIRPHAIDARFAGYLFQSHFLIDEVIARSVGVSYPAINASELMRLKIPVPGATEQSVIAAFLDRETSKIDALVAEQQNLIALLKEKRQALISHAVTKGLDPDVPMKDSGVAWLGEVPAHWEIGPLKRFAEVIDCKHHTVEFLDEGFPIVSIRELRDDRIDLSDAKRTSQAEWDFLREGRIPQAGDLIFCRNASVGAVGYVEVGQEFCMGQDVCLIRPETTNRFTHFQLSSSIVREQIEAFLVGATIRRANVAEIRGLVMTWPPAEEQARISDYLIDETGQLDGLMQEAESTIALLQERRTALISAAVTGKIDLRENN